MVKQFTIPCQFEGGQSSPVTLYIGHPEPTHHPLNWQSNWLGSARGGQIPQDLMDTIQKMHDLAQENNADFEEMCYYALISATNDQINGATSENINNFAQDFIAKEGNVEAVAPANNTTTEQTDGSQNNTEQQNNNQLQQSEADKLAEEASKIDTTQKVTPTIGDSNSNTTSTETTNTTTQQNSVENNNVNQNVQNVADTLNNLTNNEQLNEIMNNAGLGDALNQLTQAQDELQKLQKDTTTGFTQEDEDWLLNDDISLLDENFANDSDLLEENAGNDDDSDLLE